MLFSEQTRTIYLIFFIVYLPFVYKIMRNTAGMYCTIAVAILFMTLFNGKHVDL